MLTVKTKIAHRHTLRGEDWIVCAVASMVGVTLLRDNASKIFVVVSKHLPNNPALFTTCLITIVFLGLILRMRLKLIGLSEKPIDKLTEKTKTAHMHISHGQDCIFCSGIWQAKQYIPRMRRSGTSSKKSYYYPYMPDYNSPFLVNL